MIVATVLETADVLKVLLAERDFHSSHPFDVATKFHYFMGGVVFSLVGSFFLKPEASNVLTPFWEQKRMRVFTCAFLMICGYTSIMVGLQEHNLFHQKQQIRLERAVESLLIDEQIKLPEFWKSHGYKRLARQSDPETFLIEKEPDKRGFFRFHDRKIELGGLLMTLGLIVLIVSWLTFAPTGAKQED